MFVYYGALALMKLSVISLERSKKPKRNEATVMKRLGLGMIVLAVIIVGIVTLTIAQRVTKQYNRIIMISIATFTFFIVIKAIVNMVKAHRKKQSTLIMLRNISCASAHIFYGRHLRTLRLSYHYRIGNNDAYQVKEVK